MTALASHSLITRFRYFDEDDAIYVGEIETDHDGAITIMSCWKHDTLTEEVFPYSKGFPVSLRAAIEQVAIEQRYNQPATPIELPSDWQEISIKSTETTYEIETRMQLPTIMSDYFREALGLRYVQRIAPTTSNAYRVTVRGSFDEMQRELRRAAALTA